MAPRSQDQSPRAPGRVEIGRDARDARVHARWQLCCAFQPAAHSRNPPPHAAGRSISLRDNSASPHPEREQWSAGRRGQCPPAAPWTPKRSLAPPIEPSERQSSAAQAWPPPEPARSAGMPASRSSLLFSWNGIQPFGNLALYGIAEGIFSGLVKGNSVHGDMLHQPVVETIAFPKEIHAILSRGDDGNHSAGGAYNPVNSQTADQ